MNRIVTLAAAVLAWSLTSVTPAAQPASGGSVEVAVAAVTEDGQHLLKATVTRGDHPVPGVKVSFGIVRTFGILDAGEDTTLDDGTAAVAFPEGLPGDDTGMLEAVASVKPSPEAPAVERRVRVAGGRPPARPGPLPRALWSSRAPLALIAAAAFIVTAILASYGYVCVQLFRLRFSGYST